VGFPSFSRDWHLYDLVVETPVIQARPAQNVEAGFLEKKMNKEFHLGEIVVIDPTGRGHGPRGKIVGKITWLDGSTPGYMVTTMDKGVVSRHLLSNEEIMLPKD
jgi:hypothetical protein